MSVPTDKFPIVQVKNLPYHTSTSTLYELFGQYGTISQLRVPDENFSDSKANLGTCFIVYNNLSSAQLAASRLNGVNLEGRYLVATHYSVDSTKIDAEDMIVRKEELSRLKQVYGIE
ncbi:hypothetical protein G9P44_000115 [Scheffersomyces stipitis]|nr:hypothetical protein G9P44_000115 [Scheffersomyces stipitis]